VASATVGTTIGAVGAQACRGPRIRTPAARTPRLVSWIFHSVTYLGRRRSSTSSCFFFLQYRWWVPTHYGFIGNRSDDPVVGASNMPSFSP